MKMNKLGSVLWIGWLAVCAAACGGTRALSMVASYPKPSGGVSAISAVADGPVVAETVYLTVEAANPESAAEIAARLANGCGGYEGSRYAWDSGLGRSVSQEIFVPLSQSEHIRRRLQEQGWKTRESVVRHSSSGYAPGDSWAQFSIQYNPARQSDEWNDSNDTWGVPHETWGDQRADWGFSFREEFSDRICAFLNQAAAVVLQALAAFLLAAAVVISCAWFIIGAVTSIRWLFRR